MANPYEKHMGIFGGLFYGYHRRAAQAASGSPRQTPTGGNAGAGQPSTTAGGFTHYTSQGTVGASPRGLTPISQAHLVNAYAQVVARQNAVDPKTSGKAELKLGEIVALRCWRLCNVTRFTDMNTHTDREEHDPVLSSMAVEHMWEPGVPVTGDVRANGVHAFKTQKCLIDNYAQFHQNQPIVVGTVALWGEVIEHEEGYRAENGAIESIDHYLYVPPTMHKPGEMLEKLRARYLPPAKAEEKAA